MALEATGDGVWENNFSFAADYYSDRMFTMLGFEPLEPYDAFWLFHDRMHPEDHALWEAANASINSPGQDNYRLRFRVRRKDGRWCHVLARARCVARTPNGHPARVVGAHTDVTGQFELEQDLAECRRSLPAVLDALPSSIAVLDQRGEILLVNEAWRRCAAENVAGNPSVCCAGNYVDAARAAQEESSGQGEAITSAVEAALSSERAHTHLEYPRRFPDQVRWFETRVGAFQTDGFNGAIVTHDEITERHAMVQELRRVNALYKSIVDASPLAIFTLEPGSLVGEVWNPAAEQMFGWSRDEVRGKHLPEFIGEDEAESHELVARMAAGEPFAGRTLRQRRKDERRVDTSLWSAPLNPQDGASDGVVFLIADVGDRLRKETELLETKTALEWIFESLPQAVFLVNTETRIIQKCSPSVEPVFGYSREWLTGQTVRALHCDEEQFKEFCRQFKAALDGDRVHECEWRMRHRDGHVFDAALTIVPVRDRKRGHCGVVIVVEDTSRHRMPGPVFETSERPVSSLMANLKGMAYRCENDRNRTMEFASEGARELTGYAADTIVQLGTPAYADIIHESDRERVWRQIQGSVAECREFDLRYRITCASGEIKWVWDRGVAVGTHKGDGQGLEGFITDVTKEVEAQNALIEYRQRLRRLVNQITQSGESDRKSAAGCLRGDIARLLDSARVKVKEAASRTKSKGAADDLRQVQELLEKVADECRSLAAHMSPAALHEQGLGPALEGMLEEFKTRYSLDATLSWTGPAVRLDGSLEILIYQATGELLQNVIRHANAHTVRVVVQAANERIRVTVEDDGKGFNSRELVGGAGTEGCYGLFHIRERTAYLGGTCAVASKPGIGTRVSLEFPVSARNAS